MWQNSDVRDDIAANDVANLKIEIEFDDNKSYNDNNRFENKNDLQKTNGKTVCGLADEMSIVRGRPCCHRIAGSTGNSRSSVPASSRG